MRFDVLVIGGGTAGCVVAARLAEDPARTVCLVEAGPDYGPYGGAWPGDLLSAHALASSHDWGYEGGRSSSRARVIGGCSSHNACAVVWGSRADYDEWSPYVRAEVRGIFHPVATRALGRVVDSSGAVLGCAGLSVADASVIPTIPRANTNLSTVAVAELLAERIAAS